jgi:metallothionein
MALVEDVRCSGGGCNDSIEEGCMADGKKCAHPICSCTVTAGKYCSAQCEAMEKTPDIDCKCGHPACKGRTE